MEISVRKRDGTVEKFDAEKINRVVGWACAGINGVLANDILMGAQINFCDNISTKDIHESIVRSAENLISLENPNYSNVAARLLVYGLRKEAWGGNRPPKLFDHISKCVELKVYSKDLLEKYTEEEINKIDSIVHHEYDEQYFDFAGMKQMLTTYLVQDRVNKKVFETPQLAYICIGMTHFSNYKGKEKFDLIKDFYQSVALRKLNIPTPMLTGWRTPVKSGASCCLISVDDTSDSIFASAHSMANATSMKYGIGFDFSKIRCIGAPVKNGETVHGGVIPYLKVFQDTIKSQQQGGARRGAGTANAPIFHYEIQDIIQLRNVGGTEFNRVRHLDYCIAISKLFYERWQNGEDITLLSYHECPEVFNSFGLPEFDDLYKKAESNYKIKFKKKIASDELFSLLIKERIETNRLYILNIDLANEFTPWTERVSMTNLCTEVLHGGIEPIQSLEDETGEIGTCLLAATNMLNIKTDEDHRKVCRTAVRTLEEMIDIQDYFSPAAERFTKNRRSLGVGITNLAGWLASKGFNHDSEEAPNLIDEFMEKQQYFLMEASVELAQERGPAPYWERSKYSKGVDKSKLYKKDVDEIVTRKPSMDWKTLNQKIKKYGMRHMTLSCCMPCEKSSMNQNSTNGMEPIVDLFQFKDDRQGSAAWIAPNAKKYGKYYKTAYDCSNLGITKCVAAITKWLCMGASCNHYYNYGNYVDGQLETTDVAQDILLAYKYGLRTLYYARNKQPLNTDTAIEYKEMSCSIDGACSL